MRPPRAPGRAAGGGAGQPDGRAFRAMVRARELEENPFLPMTPGQRSGVLTVLGLFLCVLLAVGLLGTGGNASAPVLLGLTAYMAALAAPLYLYRGSFGWLHPLVFSVFLGILGLLRSLPLYLFGLDSHVALPNHGRAELMDLVAYSLVLATVGRLSYFAGYFLLPRPPMVRLHFRERAVRGLKLKTMAVVAFSAGAFAVYLQSQGGFTGHLLSWSRGRYVAMAGEHYWTPVVWLGALACLILFTVIPKVVRMPWFWALCGVAFPVIFFFSGSRSSLLGMMVIGLLVWMLRRRKVPVGRLLVFGALAMLLLGAMGELRRSMWRGEVTVRNISPAGTLLRMAGIEMVERNTRGHALIPILARVPDEVDLLLGQSYVAVLATPIPRKLWSGKPKVVDNMVGQAFYGADWGIPPGAIGEAFWNFHIPGVVLVFALFGVFHRWLAGFLIAYRDQRAAYLLYVVALWNFPEPSGPGLYLWLLTMVPLMTLYVVMGLFSREPPRRFAPRAPAEAAEPAARPAWAGR